MGEKTLSPAQEEWVIDRYCEGISAARLSRALGVSPKTVQRALERCNGEFPDKLKYPDTQRMTWRTELPTDNSDKLVTYADGSIGIDFYDLEFGWNYGGVTGKKILAWMNLPLPYDGKES